jgi:transcriptional regulator with XRE-family HTH domain
MARVDLGEQIATLREEQALTQVELAERARISPSTLSLIESGKVPRPHVGTTRKIARALGVEPQDLRRAEEPTSPKALVQPSLADWLEERCGHAYLTLSREEIQMRFDELEGVEDEERKRRELGLAINDEYNAFCSFPKNVTRQERLAMRRTIRNAIPDVAAKHNLALWESGLLPEYEEDAKRIFELQRIVLSDDEDIA